MNNYKKLSELVGETFTIQDVSGYTWQMWDSSSNRMLTSETFIKGYRKIYKVTTDKGVLSLGSGQLGTLLEATFNKGVADIRDKTFSVKSNGKTGNDIRYFFNLVRDIDYNGDGYNNFKKQVDIIKEKVPEKAPVERSEYDDWDTPVDLNDIPF